MPLTIDLKTARRFILGKQGLWPGRRWRGLDGTRQAMRQMEYLQLDPLQIIARSHDISLYSRVLDYQPSLWETAAYEERGFFDWGGWLAARPMDELPYWRTVMHRERDGVSHHDARVHKMLHEHAETIVEMRAILEERGTVSNRDFAMASRKRTDHYRGRKDSALALFYMWRTGEVMTHHRQNFERVYALTERVAPAHLIWERDSAEVDRFLIEKEMSFYGLSRLQRSGDSYHRGALFDGAKPLWQVMLEEGSLVEVKVEGWKHPHYIVGRDADLLAEVNAGHIPQAWTPLETTTTEEAVFLAPLDPVSARGRAKPLFGFEYVWEVYKPLEKRTFGYYVLPVLWGDQLVARFDSKLDRTTQTLVILGFWLEDATLSSNPLFAEALARGFGRFMAFLGVGKLDVSAIPAPLLRQRLAAF